MEMICDGAIDPLSTLHTQSLGFPLVSFSFFLCLIPLSLLPFPLPSFLLHTVHPYHCLATLSQHQHQHQLTIPATYLNIPSRPDRFFSFFVVRRYSLLFILSLFNHSYFPLITSLSLLRLPPLVNPLFTLSSILHPKPG